MAFRTWLAALSLSAWSCVSAHANSGLELRPLATDTFFSVPPNQPTALRFQASGTGHDTHPWTYEIRDYAEQVIARGAARLSRGRLQLTVKLPEGYYQVSFDGVADSFGFSVAPPFTGARDPFFGIDAALSWVTHDPAARKALISAIAKSGIGIARERVGWMLIEPGFGIWNWNARDDYDTVRKLYRASGIKLLEALYGGPAGWDFERDPPGDRNSALARSADKLVGRWGDVWAAVEVWNEIDLRGVDPLKYVRVLRTVYEGVRRHGRSIKVVAGAFAKFNEPYLDQLADAGLLRYADALSIHPYGLSDETREMLHQYRRWVAKRGHPELPIWISESGRAWPRGPSRPPYVDDSRSAKWNTIRGVLARSENTPVYFPFVLPFFEEKQLNYGLTDKSFTPLRAFAAYATSVRILSHAKFIELGSLRDARESYVFARNRERILVVYTKDAGSVSAPAGLRGRVVGIDGRDLGAVRDTIPVPDGIAYVISPR